MRKTEAEVTRRDILRLAGETGADPRTVTRVVEGKRTLGAIAQSIREAAQRLGIRLPRKAV
jgi:hypothetical protein